MEKQIEIKPFSEFLEEEMKDRSYTKMISEKSEEYGRKISVRTIQMYRSGTSLPSLENAMTIMKILGFDYPDNIIKRFIEAERDKQSEAKETPGFEKKVRLSFEEMEVYEIPITDLQEIIKERIEELYPGEANAFSKYAMDLIMKDLKENLIDG